MIAPFLRRLSQEDYDWMGHTLRSHSRIFKPDLTIAPDGETIPYIFRWHITPYKTDPGIYMHMQVASDPKRPLHDHPWTNVSHIRSGGFVEVLQSLPPYGETARFARGPGDVIIRAASEAHRLILPAWIPYTLTIFTTGRYEKSWGFWEGDTFIDHKDRCVEADGVSVHVKGDMA